MRMEELLYEQELKAVAFCGQSDGYLASWAREKMEEAPFKQAKVKASCEAQENARKN